MVNQFLRKELNFLAYVFFLFGLFILAGSISSDQNMVFACDTCSGYSPGQTWCGSAPDYIKYECVGCSAIECTEFEGGLSPSCTRETGDGQIVCDSTCDVGLDDKYTKAIGTCDPTEVDMIDVGGFVRSTGGVPIPGVGVYVCNGLGACELKNTTADGFFRYDGFADGVGGTDHFSVKPANNWSPSSGFFTPPTTAPEGYAPPVMTKRDGDAWNDGENIHTPNGRLSYEAQPFDPQNNSNPANTQIEPGCSSNDPGGDGLHRCNFELTPYCPQANSVSISCDPSTGESSATFTFTKATTAVNHILRIDWDDRQDGYSDNLWMGIHDWWKPAPVAGGVVYGSCSGATCTVTLPAGGLLSGGISNPGFPYMREGSYINFNIQAEFASGYRGCTSVGPPFTIPECNIVTDPPTAVLNQLTATPAEVGDSVRVQTVANDDVGLDSVRIYRCFSASGNIGVDCNEANEFTVQNTSTCGGNGDTDCSTNSSNQGLYTFNQPGTYVFSSFAQDSDVDPNECFGYNVIGNPDWLNRCGSGSTDHKIYTIIPANQPPSAILEQRQPAPQYVGDTTQVGTVATDDYGIYSVSIQYCYSPNSNLAVECSSASQFNEWDEDLCFGNTSCSTPPGDGWYVFNEGSDGQYVFAAEVTDSDGEKCFGYNLADYSGQPGWTTRCASGSADHKIYTVLPDNNPTAVMSQISSTPQFVGESVDVRAIASDDVGLDDAKVFYCHSPNNNLSVECDQSSEFNQISHNPGCLGTSCTSDATFNFSLPGTYVFASFAQDTSTKTCFGYTVTGNPAWSVRCDGADLDHLIYTIGYQPPTATLQQILPAPAYDGDLTQVRTNGLDTIGLSSVSIYYCYSPTSNLSVDCINESDFIEWDNYSGCSSATSCSTPNDRGYFEVPTNGSGQYVFAAQADDIEGESCFGYDLTNFSSSGWDNRCDETDNDHVIYNVALNQHPQATMTQVSPDIPEFVGDNVNVRTVATDDTGLDEAYVYLCHSSSSNLAIDCTATSDFTQLSLNPTCSGLNCTADASYSFSDIGQYVFVSSAMDDYGKECFGYGLTDYTGEPGWLTRCNLSDLDFIIYTISLAPPTGTLDQILPPPDFEGDLTQVTANGFDAVGVDSVSIYRCYSPNSDLATECSVASQFVLHDFESCTGGPLACSTPSDRGYFQVPFGGTGQYVFATQVTDIDGEQCFGYSLSDYEGLLGWTNRCDPSDNDHQIYTVASIPTYLLEGKTIELTAVGPGCNAGSGPLLDSATATAPLAETPTPYYEAINPPFGSFISTWSDGLFSIPNAPQSAGRICADPILQAQPAGSGLRYIVSCIKYKDQVYLVGPGTACTPNVIVDEDVSQASNDLVIGYSFDNPFADGWYTGIRGDVYGVDVSAAIPETISTPGEFENYIGTNSATVFGSLGINALFATTISEDIRYIDDMKADVIESGVVGFTPPANASELIYSGGTLSPTPLTGQVYTMKHNSFQNLIDNVATYSLDGGDGVVVIYIVDGEGKTLTFRSNWKSANARRRVFLVTESEVIFDSSLGFTDAQWLNINPNNALNSLVQMGILAKGDITFESTGSTDDTGILVEGPMISMSNVFMDRTFDIGNTLRPTTVVNFFPIYGVDPRMKTNSGLGQFDVQWIYE